MSCCCKDKLAKVINQKTPMGKGSGFKQALTHVLDGQHQKEDILIMLDADATYHSEDIPPDSSKSFENMKSYGGAGFEVS